MTIDHFEKASVQKSARVKTEAAGDHHPELLRGRAALRQARPERTGRRGTAAGDAARRRSGRIGLVQLRLRRCRASRRPSGPCWSTSRASGSDKPEVVGNFYSFAAESLAALLDELGIDRIHLLGNSLGGGTAARFALMYPKRVGRLILMGPGGLSLNLFHADPTEGIKRLYDFGANPTREALRAFISTMVVNQDLVTDELVEERFADATAPGAREAMASMGASFMKPDTYEDGFLWREAYKIRQHTLLTWGREDRVNPIDGAFAALKLIPKASLHVFPNCGHWAQIEAADEFTEIATAFLARHVEPKGSA